MGIPATGAAAHNHTFTFASPTISQTADSTLTQPHEFKHIDRLAFAQPIRCRNSIPTLPKFDPTASKHLQHSAEHAQKGSVSPNPSACHWHRHWVLAHTSSAAPARLLLSGLVSAAGRGAPEPANDGNCRGVLPQGSRSGNFGTCTCACGGKLAVGSGAAGGGTPAGPGRQCRRLPHEPEGETAVRGPSELPCAAIFACGRAC